MVLSQRIETRSRSPPILHPVAIAHRECTAVRQGISVLMMATIMKMLDHEKTYSEIHSTITANLPARQPQPRLHSEIPPKKDHRQRQVLSRIRYS